MTADIPMKLLGDPNTSNHIRIMESKYQEQREKVQQVRGVADRILQHPNLLPASFRHAALHVTRSDPDALILDELLRKDTTPRLDQYERFLEIGLQVIGGRVREDVPQVFTAESESVLTSGYPANVKDEGTKIMSMRYPTVDSMVRNLYRAKPGKESTRLLPFAATIAMMEYVGSLFSDTRWHPTVARDLQWQADQRTTFSSDSSRYAVLQNVYDTCVTVLPRFANWAEERGVAKESNLKAVPFETPFWYMHLPEDQVIDVVTTYWRGVEEAVGKVHSSNIRNLDAFIAEHEEFSQVRQMQHIFSDISPDLAEYESELANQADGIQRVSNTTLVRRWVRDHPPRHAHALGLLHPLFAYLPEGERENYLRTALERTDADHLREQLPWLMGTVRRYPLTEATTLANSILAEKGIDPPKR